MSWEETHRRWTALREVAATAAFTRDGELPWNDQYAEIFGDRDGLLTALRHRWNQTMQTQLDSHLTAGQIEDRRRDLIRENAGVLRILRRYGVTARGEERIRASA
ncbi:hypothetical protein [Nocardioides terrisoli]|uniref:hypothetical protein n=1 Tax=Nocardioides terrisoli TaxID=3388267 RepID=UPI00287B6431|nr:hypothetical protein [Nocardioides marmorisolisilvae]